jgi:hypothetical protein
MAERCPEAVQMKPCGEWHNRRVGCVIGNIRRANRSKQQQGQTRRETAWLSVDRGLHRQTHGVFGAYGRQRGNYRPLFLHGDPWKSCESHNGPPGEHGPGGWSMV